MRHQIPSTHNAETDSKGSSIPPEPSSSGGDHGVLVRGDSCNIPVTRTIDNCKNRNTRPDKKCSLTRAPVQIERPRSWKVWLAPSGPLLYYIITTKVVVCGGVHPRIPLL